MKNLARNLLILIFFFQVFETGGQDRPGRFYLEGFVHGYEKPPLKGFLQKGRPLVLEGKLESEGIMNRPAVQTDPFTRRMLTVIAAFLGAIAIGLWADRSAGVGVAHAQVPDSGKQRYDQLAEQKKTNELLGQILDHLRAKAIKVRIETTDKRSESPRPRVGP